MVESPGSDWIRELDGFYEELAEESDEDSEKEKDLSVRRFQSLATETNDPTREPADGHIYEVTDEDRLPTDAKKQHTLRFDDGEDGIELEVWVANSERGRYRGLSEKGTLGKREGMLFDWKSFGVHGLTMRDMSFPIDMVFLGEDGRVQRIVERVQPEDEQTYTGVCQYALEVPSGFCDTHGIGTAHTATLVRPGERPVEKPSDVPDEAIHVPSEEEAPEGARTITGPEDGTYYIPVGESPGGSSSDGGDESEEGEGDEPDIDMQERNNPIGSDTHPASWERPEPEEIDGYIDEVQSSEWWSGGHEAFQEAFNGDKNTAADYSAEDPETGETIWDPERAEQHREWADDLLNEDAATDEGEEPVGMVLLGPSGAGKGWWQEQVEEGAYDDELDREFTHISSDETKEPIPEYDGENASEVHDEASHIAKEYLAPEAIEGEHNVMIDKVATSPESTMRMIEAMQDAGYDIRASFVDVPEDKSVHNAVGRYHDEGRFTPLEYVAGTRSQSRDSFDTIVEEAGIDEEKVGVFNNDVEWGDPPEPVDVGEELLRMYKALLTDTEINRYISTERVDEHGQDNGRQTRREQRSERDSRVARGELRRSVSGRLHRGPGRRVDPDEIAEVDTVHEAPDDVVVHHDDEIGLFYLKGTGPQVIRLDETPEGVPSGADYVQPDEEVPEGANAVEGPGGGTYVVDPGSEAGGDESEDVAAPDVDIDEERLAEGVEYFLDNAEPGSEGQQARVDEVQSAFDALQAGGVQSMDFREAMVLQRTLTDAGADLDDDLEELAAFGREKELAKREDMIGGIEVGEEFDGFEVFVVGGAVRDHYLGKEPEDIDLMAASADVDDPIEVLGDRMDFIDTESAFPVFLDSQGREVALPRTEQSTGAGFEDFEAQVVDPTLSAEEQVTVDLERRDMTIGSIAMNARDGDKHDPFDGESATYERVIEPVSDAFQEDPIRLLRTARFAPRFDMDVSDEIYEMADEMHEGLEQTPDERMVMELQKTMKQADNPGRFFEVLDDLDVMDETFPEVGERLDEVSSSMDAVRQVTDDADSVLAGMGAGLGEDADTFAANHTLSNEEAYVLELGADVATTEEWDADRLLELGGRLEGRDIMQPEQVGDVIAGFQDEEAGDQIAHELSEALDVIENVGGAEIMDREGLDPQDIGDEISGEEFGEMVAVARLEELQERIGKSGQVTSTLAKQMELDVFQINAPEDGDYQSDILAIGVDFPNHDIYVDWNLEAFEDPLDNAHVSIYGSMEDLEDVADGDVQYIDTIGTDEVAKGEYDVSQFGTDGDPTDDADELWAFFDALDEAGADVWTVRNGQLFTWPENSPENDNDPMPIHDGRWDVTGITDEEWHEIYDKYDVHFLQTPDVEKSGPQVIDLQATPEGVPENAVYVAPDEEPPEGARTVSGPGGATYYIPTEGTDEDSGQEPSDTVQGIPANVDDLDDTQWDRLDEGLERAEELGLTENVTEVTTEKRPRLFGGDPIASFDPDSGSVYVNHEKASEEHISELAENGQLVGGSLTDTVVHECVHAAHYGSMTLVESMRVLNTELTEDEEAVLTEEVSAYAATNPLEAVSETAVKMLHGDEISEEVREIYDKYMGPEL